MRCQVRILILFFFLLCINCPDCPAEQDHCEDDIYLTEIPTEHSAFSINQNAISTDRSLFSCIFFTGDDSEKGTPVHKKLFHDIGSMVTNFFSDAWHIYSSPARLNKKSALMLGGILAVGGVMMAYDEEIYDAVQRNKNNDLVKPFVKLGENLESIGLGGKTAKYYMGTLIFGYITGIDPLIYIPAEILESYYIAGGVKNITNKLLGRKRPNENMGAYHFKFNEGTSLPSGHTANVFQLANILSHHIDFWPFTVAAYTIAGSIGIQRVTSESHWPSDVYFAAIYGWVISNELFNLNRDRRLKITPTAVDNNSVGLAVSYSF